MKIVYATDNYWPRTSGIAVSIDAFRDALVDLGHEVYIFAPDYPGAREFDRKAGNANVYRFPSLKLFFLDEDRLVSPLQKRAIYTAMTSIGPDIIHAHTEFNMGIYSSRYAGKNNIPLVFTVHTHWDEYGNYVSLFPNFITQRVGVNIRRFPFKYGDLVIAPSDAMKAILLSRCTTKPIRTVPTGIAKNDFGGAITANRCDIREIINSEIDLTGKKVLLFVGRIGIEKNIGFLIDVVERIVPLVPNVLLMIVGDGPFRSSLEGLVKQRDLERYVFFAGYIPREKLKHVYAFADVFVFASKTETQGLVILESMQCGTPVVAIGELGTKDILRNDTGGFMVHDDIDEFCQRTLLLLKNQDVYRKKSGEATEYARSWTSETTALKMQALYESVLRHR